MGSSHSNRRHSIGRWNNNNDNYPPSSSSSPNTTPQFPPNYHSESLNPTISDQQDHHRTQTKMVNLPYAHVDSTLRALAGQAEGFGRQAIGGLHGAIYHVTSLADDGPGSLRAGCRKKEPLWIVFEVSGTIELSSYLNVSSYKTIDGRGQRIKFTGKGLRLKECEHIIICNLEFEGGRGHDVDGIQIKPKSRHIWIDRCSLRDYDDGLIDITRESTDITISRCHFAQHDKTMLIGADPSHVSDRCIRVTIHHCFFDRTRQRHPRVRFGKVHLYNNYTRDWGIYAICASVEAQIYSQCNIYEAGQKKVTAFKYYTEKAADKEEAMTGCVKSEGDLFVSGTQGGLLTNTREDSVFHPSEFYSTWTVEPPTDALKHFLQHCTGWQSVPRPTDQPVASQLRDHSSPNGRREYKSYNLGKPRISLVRAGRGTQALRRIYIQSATMEFVKIFVGHPNERKLEISISKELELLD